MKKVDVLNIELDNCTKQELLNELFDSIKSNRRRFLVTANPEIIMMANKDSGFAKVIQAADYVVADGIGLIIGSKIIGNPLKERIPGVELMQDLLVMADENNLSVYFYGAKQEVLQKLNTVIKQDYPGLKIVGSSDGYSSSAEDVAKQIAMTVPDLVFVAMGAPRQETWIYNHYKNFSKGIFIGVGGSFDVLSGTVKRAPKVWRKLNLEWLYRILTQPARWKRSMLLPAYLVAILQIRFKKRQRNSIRK
ncbi:acetylglucosaminyldiphospho-UDP acetyl-beta-D-mannosaminyltransferase [Bhargavaea cecembensis]|uniref:N-acetylglucosaminyldiphosphoundecaprenol N-acetyl-beta-D-mannosaminyltransferase n=1 Tax=Bhargavaea cecembensis TaxID=394098 RepID=A0A161RJI5_9BACL|nr:WecB/TagA/CpsF family glycosyltransferase [Bhargavaea cecembensis]KZE38398.1 acetylglucosaminyldiphospho-UDP acetyl-beta-D-mannosaminyltransferase [Bhargavaea cecembensis]